MPIRTDSKTLVMAALAQGPRHGYALAKTMHEALGERQNLANGQVYTSLRGLEAEGLVASDLIVEGSERRVYHLTDEGRRELEWRAAEWHRCVDVVAQLLPRPGHASSVSSL